MPESEIPPFEDGSPVPWTQLGYYLHQRPSFTFDPLFHAGCYYVQEASSMFLEQVLKQTVNLSEGIRILDLSAAPGGKSTHIQSMITKDSLLVSNEVIRPRASILRDNIIKWGGENVIVTNNDPKNFAKLESYFDVIVVDAPCSGSGLFRREPGAINEWSEDNVALCSQRQQRILADIIPALKKDGVLIYSTCSYSKEEDEDITDWLINDLKLQSLRLQLREDWNIVEVQGRSSFGYRFWPDRLKGEGFFIACFRNSGREGENLLFKSRNKLSSVSKKEKETIERWANTKHHQLVRHENTVYAWPEALANDIGLILSKLKLLYSGVRLGELMGEKLIPDHALAMSTLVGERVGRVELNNEQAIQYLQRKDLRFDTEKKGWQLANYHTHPLGWINVLPNRINNYYPKELRILKDH